MSLPSSPILSSVTISKETKIALAKALGIEERTILAIGRNGLMDIIVEVDPSLDFSYETMKIDPLALLKATPEGTRSQVITSSWSKNVGVDFAKRVFAYGVEGTSYYSPFRASEPRVYGGLY